MELFEVTSVIIIVVYIFTDIKASIFVQFILQELNYIFIQILSFSLIENMVADYVSD